jgi:hypothetical protein
MVASRNRRIEEHSVLIASFRIRKDLVKACSKTSPSASNVFWAGGGIATFRQFELDAILHSIGVGTAGSNTITVAGK